MALKIFGAGAMGVALSRLVAATWPDRPFELIDNDPEQLAAAARTLPAARVTVRTARSPADADLRAGDLCLGAMPWAPTVALAEAGLTRGDVTILSMTRPDYADLPRLESMFAGSSLTLVYGCGLEPGLTELLAGHLMSACDEVIELHIRCGGLVVPRPDNPLGYKRLFGTRRLPFAIRPALAVAGGRLVEVPRFSEVETVDWPEVGRLECWHDGMMPHLAEHPAIGLRTRITQKTLRWPGYAAGIEFLRQLGVLDEDTPTALGPSPKQLLEEATLATFTLGRDERTVTLLSVACQGIEGGRESTRTLALRFCDWTPPASADVGDTAVSSMGVATALPLLALARRHMDMEMSARRGLLRVDQALAPADWDRLLADAAGFGAVMRRRDLP